MTSVFEQSVLANEVKVGIRKEAAFGTYESATANGLTEAMQKANANMYLIPVEPPEIREEVMQIIDTGVRGVPAMDFQAFSGMRQVTGTLSGYFYANDSGALESATAATTEIASPFAHVLRAFFGGSVATQLGGGASYIHDFYTARAPGSLSLQVEDTLTDKDTSGSNTGVTDANYPICYAGVMIPRLTLSFDAGEGMFMWEAELLGVRQLFLPRHPAAAVTGTTYAGNIGVDLSQKAFVGWNASGSFDGTLNPASNGQVLSAEITLEREIELSIGANNIQYANILASRPMQATFSAVLQLRKDYAEYQKYSKDTGVSRDYEDFADNLDPWTFRFSTLRGVTTVDADTTFDDSGTNDLEDKNDAVFDIRFHRVSLGESPLTIARDGTTNTMEFNGRAIYARETPTWFGAPPPASPATVQESARMVQIRLINQRTANY